ncbi:MAG TPA: hypothetical protein VD995_14785 [Azospirillum sp.]|nr:hypothetical protein [Azospirillum sp.]
MKDIVHLRSAQGLVVALSLANLCFLTVWRELLFAEPADSYWLPEYTATSYAAAIVNVLVLTLLLWAVPARLAGSSTPWLATLGRLLLLAVLLIPLNYLRLVLGVAENAIIWIVDHWPITLPVAAAVALSAFYAMVVHLRALTQAVAVGCVILAPFAVSNLAQAAWTAARLTSATPGEAAPPDRKAPAGPRIVWLIMDELDLRLAFLQRPAGVVLPEFDRLRGQAFFALNAHSHSKNTKQAIPSFLTQKVVALAEPRGAAALHLTFEDFENAPDEDLDDTRHYFAEAAAAGARIGLVGYYHPYCRLFWRHLASCTGFAMNTYAPESGHSLAAEALSQLVGITPFSRRFNAIHTYKAAEKEILRLVANNAVDIVYVHAPVPHGPNIWDAKTDGFTIFNTTKDGYFDNLVLADRLLGRIRGAMERADLWDRSVVLLTSDHEWRHSYLYDNRRIPKIPFLLKMPGQETALEFSAEFSPMRVTKDLLLRLQSQQLTTPEEVAYWIGHSQPRPSKPVLVRAR